ncbi:MAG: DNA mismatch repair endonuclease MutL [Capnocytophaga sp.]|nr:DNA mismatch repair endonuclease MutL [Capnocytophaga sp.]
MTDIIRLLPDHVANQIAAGEVIQRPASAVKELLENAIDAKATQVKLIIKDAGRTLVQVIDNGIGMSVTDARMAFERHATSKIQKAEDLFQLQTKGFRGEALASIAAIAHVELITKRASDELGTALRIEGSKITHQEPCVTAGGTSIAMKNLFFNIPARRNFLKSDPVELRHVLDEFHRVALAHPDIHFYMYNNGSELYNLPSTHLRQRIVHLFGGKTNEKLVPVEEKTTILDINGYIVKPEYIKKSKSLQFLMVNHRFIKSGYLHRAIASAYEGLIDKQLQPQYFIHLQIDPATIDINIHPTKTEIKFENEYSIHEFLKSAVKHSLGQFKVAAKFDFEADPNMELPYAYKEKIPEFPKIEVDASFNPFDEKKASQPRTAFRPEKQPAWESIYSGTDIDLPVWESQTVESKLFEAEVEDFTLETKRKIISLSNKYLLTTLGQDLLIIHANRAHQRVLYEQIMRTLSRSNTASQQLMFPIELHFSKSEIMALEAQKMLFERFGFMFSITDDTLIISGIPLHINEGQIAEVFESVLSDQAVDAAITSQEIFARRLCQSLAVKTGQTLSEQEQEVLIGDLFACQEHLVSPFGKKIVMNYSTNDFDKNFNFQ